MKTRNVLLAAVYVLASGFWLGMSVVSADQGGPDTFGYRWRDSKLPAPQEPYNWIEIAPPQGGSGTELADLTGSDDQAESAPIGFDFSFYGNTKSNAVVSSNGFITFDSAGATAYSNTGIPNASNPNDAIFAFWDDLAPGHNPSESKVYYQTQGAAPNRRFIVEWYRVPHISDIASRFTFQAILHEGSGDITVQFHTMTNGLENYADGRSASVGIENAGGTDGLPYWVGSGAAGPISNGLALRFSSSDFAPSVITNVNPSAGSWTGGYAVVISGTDLGDGTDITNVTLCAVGVAGIVSQSATQVVVTAGATATPGVGDVRVFSASQGETVKSAGFEYIKTEALLTVVSAYGAPSPTVGTHTNAIGATVTNSVASPVVNGTTRYLSTGWTMTGNAPVTGLNTQFTMTVTNDAVLTWQWAREFYLATGTNGHGTVTVASGWRAEGAVVDIGANAAALHRFLRWEGGVPADREFDNPLTVTMDQARSLTARFGRWAVVNDFDGDGKTDLAVCDPRTYHWYVKQAGDDVLAWELQWGYDGVSVMSEHFTGDGKSDFVVYDTRNGNWFVRTLIPYALAWYLPWGYAGTTPAPGDYDGDGKADFGVYDTRDGNWFVRTLAGDVLAWYLPWGYSGTTPVVGDYNGDGKCDLGVYDPRTGQWFIRTLTGDVLAWYLQWGYQGAVLAPGDYDGDGRTDVGVYDTRTGNWFIRTLAGDVLAWYLPWGYAGTVAIPGDYNGDGKCDLGIYDPRTGQWYVKTLAGQVLVWDEPWGGTGLDAVGGRR